MMNYMKSELYRIWRSKGIYLLIGGCMILMLAMNLVLWAFGKSYDFYIRIELFQFSDNGI